MQLRHSLPVLLCLLTATAQQPAFDLVIENGLLIDGTGSPGRQADIGIRNNRIASIAKYHASLTARHAADKAQQFFGGYGLARESRVAWMTSYAYLYFNGEGSSNVQRVLIAEDALGYKKADRHAGTLRFRDPRNCPEPVAK